MSQKSEDLISLSTQGSNIELNENLKADYPKYTPSEVSNQFDGEKQGSYIGVQQEDHNKIDVIANDLGKIRNSILSQNSIEESNSNTSKTSGLSQIGTSKGQRKNKKKLQKFKDKMDDDDFGNDEWGGGEEIDRDSGSDYGDYDACQTRTAGPQNTAASEGCCVIL